jgi:hypothetical protein
MSRCCPPAGECMNVSSFVDFRKEITALPPVSAQAAGEFQTALPVLLSQIRRILETAGSLPGESLDPGQLEFVQDSRRERRSSFRRPAPFGPKRSAPRIRRRDCPRIIRRPCCGSSRTGGICRSAFPYWSARRQNKNGGLRPPFSGIRSPLTASASTDRGHHFSASGMRNQRTQ